jgi:hypothetical protein
MWDISGSFQNDFSIAACNSANLINLFTISAELMFYRISEILRDYQNISDAHIEYAVHLFFFHRPFVL